MSDNFLSRWSRRKIEVRAQENQVQLSGQAVETSAVQAPVQQPGGNVVETASASTQPIQSPLPDVPLPTEADLKLVEEGGDIKAFLTDKVAPELKNKAFKALFSRPEFNVMDGLDIYIDDYNKFIPLTQEDIGKMSLSKQLLSRPDLDVIKPDVLVDPHQTEQTESLDGSNTDAADCEPVYASDEVPKTIPNPANHETVRVIPDALQATDSEDISANRSFEKPGDFSA